ncbi:MAG TPA: hypothetical protein GXX53_00395 [Tissierellia bacterium]|nr:hypothetical protein [Tissierellia bacterium]
MSKKTGVLLLLLILISLFFNIVSFVNISNISLDKEAIESSYDSLLSEVQSLKKEISRLTEDNEVLRRNISYAQQMSDINSSIIKEQVKLIDLKKDWRFLRDNELFPIYDANEESNEKEVIFYTSFPKTLKLNEKLRGIGNKLSQYCFNGLPIELEYIKDIEGKKVAVINLRESYINEGLDIEDKVGYTWLDDYFQGSTGGMQTYIRLVETFLQRDYKGEWIDGVEFLYEGSKINYEHIEGLSEIIYR